MYKKILVPLDHSDADPVILDHVRRLAKFCHSEIHFLHVADGFAARLQNELNLVDSEEITRDRAYLLKIENEFRSEGFEVSSELAKGDPVKGILSCAEQRSCDLIAMGTHGHGAIKDLLYGTVAESVRHKTEIPVLLIKMP